MAAPPKDIGCGVVVYTPILHRVFRNILSSGVWRKGESPRPRRVTPLVLGVEEARHLRE